MDLRAENRELKEQLEAMKQQMNALRLAQSQGGKD